MSCLLSKIQKGSAIKVVHIMFIGVINRSWVLKKYKYSSTKQDLFDIIYNNIIQQYCDVTICMHPLSLYVTLTLFLNGP